MSFRRIDRQLYDRRPTPEVGASEIGISWRDDADAPVMMILIGERLARQMVPSGFRNRAELFMGEFADAGKMGVRLVSSPFGDYRVQGARGGYRIFIPCIIAVDLFHFSPSVRVASEEISLQGDTAFFPYAGIKA